MQKTIKIIVGGFLIYMGVISVFILMKIMLGLEEFGVKELVVPLIIALVYIVYMMRSRISKKNGNS